VFTIGSLGVLPAADEFKPEEGFKLLFNGKDLTGWKIAAYKDKDKPGESLDGKAQSATKRYVVKDGALIVDDKVKGDMILMTSATFAKDAHIKFDFKPGKGCNNDLIFRGMKYDIKTDIKNLKEGDWNSFDIILKGDKAEFKCNGESVKTLVAKPAATNFGLRAEFGSIELRRIRVKE
jgi:hypothetical protein